uniref:SOCS box domain-containing protein n=1 Tax=Trichogramma kaykai TaxID=54128 RepID=A0ABD2X6M8_9HYME
MIAENSFNDRRFEEAEYRLLCIINLDNRRYEFCQYMNSAEDPDFNNMILSKLMEELFPKFEDRIYFLMFALEYNSFNILELLQTNNINVHELDHERSTPVHALAWLCLCECGSTFSFCDYRKPVDDIVKMLIIKGANVEARNEDGDTPLSLAVRRFDFELTKALLDNGASLDSLNEDKLFSWNFTQLELKNYPLTLNIIKVMQLLISSEYIINFHTRKKMLKCWLKVRGNDTIFIPRIPSEYQLSYLAYDAIVGQIWIHERFGFYIKQEALDCLQKQKLLLEKSRYVTTYEPLPKTIERWDRQVANLNEIKLNGNISLYELCQMSYDRGYSILKNMKNWRVPSLDGLEHSYINLMVKRHVANILIRLHLELFAADLFMTEYCKLNLPYTVCRIIAEKMSHEDLIRLGE